MGLNSNTWIDSTSESACTYTSSHTKANGCTSNQFGGGRQCLGFARYLYWLYNGEKASSANQLSSVGTDYVFTVGDMINYYRDKGTHHAVIVYAVNGDTITLAEGNWYGKCKISCTRKMDRSELIALVNSNQDYTYVIPSKTSAPTPSTPAPDAPQNFTATYKTDESATLSWSASSGAMSYRVQYYSLSRAAWTDDTGYTNNTATSYVMTGLKNYSNWDFRVCAVNAGGQSGWTTVHYDKSESTHTHSFIYKNEVTHPHKEYRKCTECSYTEYTGEIRLFSTCNQCCVLINETNFPDANFRSYISTTFDYQGNGYLTLEQVAAVTEISVDSKAISNLKGVEYFTSLTRLDCSFNELSAIDVSQNTQLQSLKVTGNKLSALDVSKNNALTVLSCSRNQLTVLDVSGNALLTSLSCAHNQLNTLDVSKNTALVELICSSNHLCTLDLSENTALQSFRYDNQVIVASATLEGDSFVLDISSIVGSENLGKVSNVFGGNYDAATGKLLLETPKYPSASARYYFDTGMAMSSGLEVGITISIPERIYTVASGECGANGDNLTWSLNSVGILTISGAGAMRDYLDNEGFVVPIPWADYAARIKEVIIENGVTSIGTTVFDHCEELTLLTIPDSVVNIGSLAFFGCKKLSSLTIPAGVESIGDYAFSGCESLTDVYVDASNKYYTSKDGVLYNKAMTELLICPGSKTGVFIIPTGVTVIGDYAFNECSKLTKIVIPDGVTTIGASAFDFCSALECLTIPASVTKIGEAYPKSTVSFCDSLASIEVDPANVSFASKDGVVYNKNLTELLIYPNGKTGNFVIPDGVLSLANSAFYNCKKLTDIKIPNSITCITSHAFQGCQGLITVTIPASISSIGCHAFSDCENLKEIQFYHSSNATLTFEEATCSGNGYGSRAFCNGSQLATTVIVPDTNNINSAISGYDWAGDNRTVTYKSASDSPRHAPNMYVDWITGNAYDVISVDWCCDKDANNTYWAVHNWDGGYAGFQNKDGQHVLLLSLWDLADGTSPTIEYSLNGENGSFGGEGTGKQVFTNYDWQVGKWYTMCIQVSSDNDKSYYTQYVKEENGDWLKTAVISYPITGNKFFGSSVFQEDFTFNNLMRSCRLRNASGRIYGTDTWESWNNCKISNSFFPTDSATWESGVQLNIDFDCNWDNHGDYIWVQSGGEGFDSNEKQIPVEYSLSNSDIPAKSLFDKQDSFSEKVSVNLNEIAADKAASGGFVAIDMNGKVCTADENGSFGAIELGNSETVLAAVSGYNVSASADVHTMYPTSMEVYLLCDEDGKAKIQHISEFDDLLRYSGCSIRITGKKGIRMITSVDGALKSSLINGGVAGYTLEEYGTLLCFSNEMVNGSLCLDDSYARHNYAYSRATGADPVFKYSGSMIQYTNVLVGFNLEQCTEDIAMRPYIVLSDAQGNRHTVYGGIVYRSIGYIAYQNRNAFSPTDPAYDYIWDIIHHVYGDKYDAEYKK